MGLYSVNLTSVMLTCKYCSSQNIASTPPLILWYIIFACHLPTYHEQYVERYRQYLCVHLDDILIYDADSNAHSATVNSVVSVLSKYGVRLRREKCKFGVAQLTYLVT